MTTTEVENFPGFSDGIMGPELMAEMREQAARFGADLRGGRRSGRPDRRRQVGHRRRRGVQGPLRRAGHRFGRPATSGCRTSSGWSAAASRACATCDGFFFRGHDIVVVGGGDTAMEEATFLTKFANTVTIVHRREDFRASPIMLDRARANPKIRLALNSAVDRGARRHHRLRRHADRHQDRRDVASWPSTGVFVAIGHDPRSDSSRGVIDMDPEGYVQAGEPAPGHVPSRACSPAVTWWTTPTVRRSPRRDRAARRPSTPITGCADPGRPITDPVSV